MKKLLTLIAFICFWANANAQYVNIPDSNFRSFLIRIYPSCFNANKEMDTTCNLIANETSLYPASLKIKNLDGIQYFKKLQFLSCQDNYLTSLPNLPNGLLWLECNYNLLISLTNLPNNLTSLNCNNNQLTSLPTLPNSLDSLDCNNNQLTSLPALPNSLTHLFCNNNQLTSLPALPNSLTGLYCDNNNLTSLSNLPNSLTHLFCNNNQLTSLPYLPNALVYLYCSNNSLERLPILPNNLLHLNCSWNKLTELQNLPNSLTSLNIFSTNINCLPYLPNLLNHISLNAKKIKCLPNATNATIMNGSPSGFIINLPLCNPTNNSNSCYSFPVIQSFAYTDNNNNNKQDNNEYSKHNLKLTLSNNNYTYTNTQGTAYINADSLGTYTITAQAPPLYNVVPASYTHTFNSYDTLVLDTFALQPIVIKDSLAVNVTPLNFAARPGFKYSIYVSYENVGTTVLNPNLSFVMDTSKYIFDSTNNAAINFSGNTLSLGANNFVPGQTNSFLVYGRVKPTAVLGSSLQAIASITGGSATAVDTAKTTVRGSFDPNDKHATPQLSVAQVADNNHWIDYTIRFENTGTDTAFTVVVADTLDDTKVQINSLQLKSTSHNVKATQNDKIVYFEFLNINLPDSNTNKIACNGFVNFRVKPSTTLVNGNIVPNKASIYFDYNEPIITNTATTIIGSTLPLSLTALGAIPKPENNTILVYFNTANEINTSYFIIEQSLDARTFKACAEVAAIGKGNNSYYYNIAKNNVQYIRLKMVDKNGTYSYSNIIRISIDEKRETIVIQSPAQGILKINVMAASLDNTKASLVNSKGKVVKTFTLKQGYQTIDIDALPSGLYYVQANDAVRKIIVNR